MVHAPGSCPRDFRDVRTTDAHATDAHATDAHATDAHATDAHATDAATVATHSRNARNPL
jgi:cyclopropane-fatty-acyl-phospholipid synthase